MSNEDAVTYRAHDGWAEIRLNRPERRNAINGPLGQALCACARRANDDPDIRAVVLSGSGGAFCSGLDLKAFNADPAPAWLSDFQTIWRSAHRALFELRPVLIVALERYAINGGAALALAGDLLVMGDDAFLQVGEVQQGMAAPYNLAWLRLRHSEAVAAKVALLGERIAGPEAVRLGLATESVTAPEVLARARALASAIAGYPVQGLAQVKSVMRRYGAADADVWFDRAFAGASTEPVAPRANPS